MKSSSKRSKKSEYMSTSMLANVQEFCCECVCVCVCVSKSVSVCMYIDVRYNGSSASILDFSDHAKRCV